MRRFIKEISTYGLLFASGFILLSFALYYVSSKKSYDHYQRHITLFKLNDFLSSSANTAFVGTSKTAFQINPTLFDERGGGNIISYNLGIAGMFPLRQLDLVDKVSEKKNLKNLFIEIAPLDRISINYNSNSNVYAMTPKRYYYALDYINKNQLSFRNKMSYTFHHTRSFLYKYLGIGGSKQLTLLLGCFEYPTNNDEIDLHKDLINGFISFDDLIEKGHLGRNEIKKAESFQKNGETDLKVSMENYKSSKEDLKEISDLYFEQLISQADRILESGTKVYYYLPPRQREYGLKPVLNIKNRLEKLGYPVFDFSDPEDFPELYSLELSHDFSHLNKKGANLLTLELVNDFLETTNQIIRE